VEAPPAGSGEAAAASAAPADAAVEGKPVAEPAVESSEPAVGGAPAAAPPAEVKETAEKKEGEPSKETDATKEAVPKVTAEMSFKERMDQRAKRFGIPPTENTKKETRAQRFGTGKAEGGANKNNPKKQQQGGNKGKGGQNNRPTKDIPKKQQQAGNKRDTGNGGGGSGKKQKVAEKPLLPKEEIEKRLARAAKYGTTEGVDGMKAMLRKHRFSTE